ncbi:MAG: glycine cleavage system protein H [Bacteroidales bacterium]
MPHDFMTMHAAKTVEYLIAVGYLLLFIPFWRFVNARPQAAAAPAHVPVRHKVPALAGWFSLPERLFYHPGHAWLRVDGADTVTVGINDFAARLVGTPSAVNLPSVGSALRQGEPGWSLAADGAVLDMLSPVDGTVTEVNTRLAWAPDTAARSPYEDGWLLKVRNPRLAANLKQLFSGQLARRWMQDLADGLRTDLTPALGLVSEDGGVVVDGLAKAIAPENWEAVARQYLLTDTVADGGEGGNHA